MKKVKVTCIGCGSTYSSEKIKINKIRRSDGLTEIFYLCPKCKKRYVVCIHSDETLKIQDRINRLDKRGMNTKARKLRLELKEKLDRLNNK